MQQASLRAKQSAGAELAAWVQMLATCALRKADFSFRELGLETEESRGELGLEVMLLVGEVVVEEVEVVVGGSTESFEHFDF